MSIQVLCTFQNQVMWFCCCWDIPYQINCFQIFFAILYVAFSLCWYFPFPCRSFLVWCSSICLCYFCCLCLHVTAKKSLQRPIPSGFSPVFSPRVFIVSSFYSILNGFLYPIYSKDPVSFFCIWISSLPTHLLKRLSFPHIVVLAPLLNVIWVYMWNLFLSSLLLFIPVLLRYNWHITVYKLKMYSIITWLTYIMEWLTRINLVNIQHLKQIKRRKKCIFSLMMRPLRI